MLQSVAVCCSVYILRTFACHTRICCVHFSVCVRVRARTHIAILRHRAADSYQRLGILYGYDIHAYHMDMCVIYRYYRLVSCRYYIWVSYGCRIRVSVFCTGINSMGVWVLYISIIWVSYMGIIWVLCIGITSILYQSLCILYGYYIYGYHIHMGVIYGYHMVAICG